MERSTMKRERITAGRVRDLQLPPGKDQVLLRDTDCPGFAVRVTAGSKSFVFNGKLAGKDMRITIGSVLAWGIDEARAEARRFKTSIDKGIDPRKEKADRLAKVETDRLEDERQEVLFGDAWKAYMDAKKQKWSARHYADHEKAISDKKIPGPLTEFVPLKLAEINPERVKSWLDKNLTTRPTFTAICFRKLRAFLGWCSDHEEYADITSAESCSRKVSRDKLPKNKAKTDCLQREQVKSWFDAVKALSSPTISAYLQTLLLTGARREEMATLTWKNVDLQWKAMTISDKIEGERTIPLTPYVESLLRDLKIRNETPPPKHRILHGKKIEIDLGKWKPSPWVFSSQTAESGRITEPRIGHNRAITVAGLPPLTLHGLRRSFGTLAEWVECPTGISAQIMGHKPSALAEKHYRQRPLDLLRMWHTQIEGWILEQAGIEQPKEANTLIRIENVAI